MSGYEESLHILRTDMIVKAQIKQSYVYMLQIRILSNIIKGDAIFMKLIFNADDFGYSKGVNLGIVETFRRGLVRSTTIMACMPGFCDAVLLARKNSNLKIGIHLMLTTGKSILAGHKTITNASGNFFTQNEFLAKIQNKEIDLLEVEAEFEAQIQKVIAKRITPVHFDSHHHVHNLPGIIEIFLKLAKKYDTKVRINDRNLLIGEYGAIQTTEAFYSGFYGEDATCDKLKDVLTSYIDVGVRSLEIMCHPAFIDYTLHSTSIYTINRAYEVDILTNKDIKNFVTKNKLQICSFEDI